MAAGEWLVSSLQLRKFGRRGATAMAALLAGCSPVAVLNGLSPDRLAASGIAYGDDPRQKLDVYAPTPGTVAAPIVLFIYGGNWRMGGRAMYRFAGAALAARGCVVVIADYRLYPQVLFPEFLRDGALAARWARDHAEKYGADPRRLFLMGHSAGAYNAAMLALDSRWLSNVAMASSDIAGMIGVAGPYDFLPLEDPILVEIFGGNGSAIAPTQPIEHADGRNPPMLLLAGDADTTVRPANTVRLARRIGERGGPVHSRIYAGVGHEAIIGALASPLTFLAPTLQDTMNFIASPSNSGPGG